MSQPILKKLFHSITFVILLAPALTASADNSDSSSQSLPAETLATQVTIHRDEWGVAHVFGDTDEATIFGVGYIQAEDYFWQLEDTTIQAIGRYAEIQGEEGLKTDLLVRSFELPGRSQQDFETARPEYQLYARAFAEGVNFYLDKHPREKLRLLKRFEPWHVVAIDRYLMLTMTYGGSSAGKPRKAEASFSSAGKSRAVPKYSWQWADPESSFERESFEAVGSNAWAIAPSRTESGNAMLFINPHQPWYGIGQFYELHLHSRETLRFSGACFFGTPIPTLGHSEYLGWTYTVNEPDVADSWDITFDDPDEPMNYRYGNGHRTAEEWTEKIGLLAGNKVVKKNITFRKTHHGPIVRQQNGKFIAARVGRLYSLDRFGQALGMIRSRNFKQWHQAFSRCAIPMFNVTYADRDGTIFYCYNGAIPVRREGFRWKGTVDGSNPETEWNGYHTLEQLPQVLNPKCGYVQSCNSSPFTTTDQENPKRGDFPDYMVREIGVDRRRSKRSRQLLSQARGITFEEFRKLNFDTRVYWHLAELENWKREFAELQKSAPDKAATVKPYLDHLAQWDGNADVESTGAALCIHWYEELYGSGQAEKLKPEYQHDSGARLMALVKAGQALTGYHGDWKVPWGNVHRHERVAYAADTLSAGVRVLRSNQSIPVPGAPGPLGIVFTMYSSPSIWLIRPQRIALVGCSYMSAVEFGDKVHAGSLVAYGTSGDPRSPHFENQRQLLAEGRYKNAYYYPDEVLAAAKRSYHPGEE
jgi:acyl-homoserine-lactone acylase